MAKSKGLKIAVGSALVAATLMTTVPAASAAGLFNFSFSGIGGGGVAFPKAGGWSFFGNWGGNGQTGGFWGVTNRWGATFGFFWGRPVSPYAA